MADLVIRGMEMPTNVYDCPLNTFGFCNLAHDSNHIYCIGDSRPEWCPLVPLPEGHGRLGDLDALMNNIGDVPYKGAVRRVLMSAPTIVPAEGSVNDGN